MFPGQGSQQAGMGKELLDKYSDLLIDDFEETLGWSLQEIILKVNKEIGFLAHIKGNIFILGLQGELRIQNLKTKKIIKSIYIEPEIKLNRINDGKTDPAGNLWFGTMDNLERKIEYIEMPNLIGKTVRDAFSELKKAGIKPQISGRGLIVSQSIEAGTKVEKKSICILKAEIQE